MSGFCFQTVICYKHNFFSYNWHKLNFFKASGFNPAKVTPQLWIYEDKRAIDNFIRALSGIPTHEMTFHGVLIWDEHETWNPARDARLI